MSIMLIFWTWASLSLCVSAVQSDSYSVEGFELQYTVYDFREDFPDMTTSCTDDMQDVVALIVHKDLVEEILGDDGKPVYTERYVGCRSTPENFAMWYKNISGVNQEATGSLFFSESESGSFIYENDVFTPIDNMLGGNEGLDSNHFFTMEISTQFLHDEGLWMTLCASDDAWVFIDNHLVIDLGGQHPTRCDTVDFDALGLTSGYLYDINVFYAQRQENITGTFHLELSHDFIQSEVMEYECPVYMINDDFCAIDNDGDLISIFQREKTVYTPYDTTGLTVEEGEPASFQASQWYFFRSGRSKPSSPWDCVDIEVHSGIPDAVTMNLYRSTTNKLDICDDSVNNSMVLNQKKPNWDQLELIDHASKGSSISCAPMINKGYYFLQVDASNTCGALKLTRYASSDSSDVSAAALLEDAAYEYEEAVIPDNVLQPL